MAFSPDGRSRPHWGGGVGLGKIKTMNNLCVLSTMVALPHQNGTCVLDCRYLFKIHSINPIHRVN